MTRANENALPEQGADTAENFTLDWTPPMSSAADLRRTLHLVADSAIAADDAITRNDTEGFNRAIAVLALNADTVQKLALNTAS